MHTWVYILVTVPVHVPPGIFGTILFPVSCSFFPRRHHVAGISVLASCGDLVSGLSLPSSHPLLSSPPPHLCWHPQAFLCLLCLRSWLSLVSFPLRPLATFLAFPAEQCCWVCSDISPSLCPGGWVLSEGMWWMSWPSRDSALQMRCCHLRKIHASLHLLCSRAFLLQPSWQKSNSFLCAVNPLN